MSTSTAAPLVHSLIITVIAALVALAGSDGGVSAWGVPVFALCGALAFVINWLAFVPSFAAQTEHYFDLTGSVTYLAAIGAAIWLSVGQRGPDIVDARGLILGAFVAIWALRLGSFLFKRIRRAGSDGRFDDIKVSGTRFFRAWTLQGLWVLLTAACALAAITTGAPAPLGVPALIGIALWLAGFAIEVVADRQKQAFRDDPENRGQFITTGLWAWSRHPNYFGEIVLWLGVAVVAIPALSGWQHVTLISPVFVYLLLTRVSGVPLLERRADERWGDDERYQRYKANTPALFPRPPRASNS